MPRQSSEVAPRASASLGRHDPDTDESAYLGEACRGSSSGRCVPDNRKHRLSRGRADPSAGRHIQLQHWQHNLASRVASEAETLDIEVDKLHDNELDAVRQRLRTA